MSTRIEPRDEYSETLIVIHDCGHETRYVCAIGCAAGFRDRHGLHDKPECARCARRRAAQQEEGKA